MDEILSKVSSALQAIQSNVTTVENRLRLLGSARDTPVLREKLHHVQEETTKLLQSTANDIKRLNDIAEATHLPQNKVTAERITRDFSNVMARFQAAQKNYAIRSKAELARAKRALDEEEIRMDSEDAPLMMSRQGVTPGMSSQAQLLQTHDLEITYNEAIIAQRENEIQEIEEGVVLVNDIFRKIGTLVKDQGQLFDNIEANLQVTDINVENAATELSRANKRARTWREVKCWILLVLLVLAALLALIIAFA